jgi:hypothetical protein
LEPSESWEWFTNKYPGRLEYILKAQNKLVKWTPDRLLEVREKIRNRDLQGLLIAPELLS